jgi:hypothetical protein
MLSGGRLKVARCQPFGYPYSMSSTERFPAAAGWAPERVIGKVCAGASARRPFRTMSSRQDPRRCVKAGLFAAGEEPER